jgi:hypothetical protein
VSTESDLAAVAGLGMHVPTASQPFQQAYVARLMCHRSVTSLDIPEVVPPQLILLQLCSCLVRIKLNLSYKQIAIDESRFPQYPGPRRIELQARRPATTICTPCSQITVLVRASTVSSYSLTSSRSGIVARDIGNGYRITLVITIRVHNANDPLKSQRFETSLLQNTVAMPVSIRYR